MNKQSRILRRTTELWFYIDWSRMERIYEEKIGNPELIFPRWIQGYRLKSLRYFDSFISPSLSIQEVEGQRLHRRVEKKFIEISSVERDQGIFLFSMIAFVVFVPGCSFRWNCYRRLWTESRKKHIQCHLGLQTLSSSNNLEYQMKANLHYNKSADSMLFSELCNF